MMSKEITEEEVDGRGSGGQWSIAVAVAADYGEDWGPQWVVAVVVGSSRG
jgi:hypothetical protein